MITRQKKVKIEPVLKFSTKTKFKPQHMYVKFHLIQQLTS